MELIIQFDKDKIYSFTVTCKNCGELLATVPLIKETEGLTVKDDGSSHTCRKG
jgi:hypothetical protein